MDTIPLNCAKRKKGVLVALMNTLNLLHFEFLIGTKLKTIASQLTFQLNQLQKSVIQLVVFIVFLSVRNSSGSDKMWL